MRKPEIRLIDAASTRPIRGDVLRPGQPSHRLMYPGDDAETSLHLGCVAEGGHVVAVVSLYDECLPDGDEPAWRIRGMATHEGFRSLGYGRLLLRACLEHVMDTRPGVVWCNARTTAAGFYRSNEFEQRGPVFEIEDIGPHVIMTRSVKA